MELITLIMMKNDEIPKTGADKQYLTLMGNTLFTPCMQIVTAREAFKYVPAMTEIMLANNGVGISANQVGLLIPLFLFKRHDGRIQPVYKPKVNNHSKEWEAEEEGCLSFPESKAKKSRPLAIDVSFCSQKNGKFSHMKLYGLEARIFLHEQDHLAGKTIVDPF